MRGLLRHYTIFSDGAWKRTMFGLTTNGVQEKPMLVPRFSVDSVVLEGINLLGQVCTLHPSWENIAAQSETLSVDDVRDRTKMKKRLTGLGAPRPKKSS